MHSPLPVTKHRTLWISDVHLGSPGCQAKQLVHFLAQNDCDTLYLVGDIIDGWKLKKNFFWTPDHTRVIKAILAKARHGTKVYYLTGNHDEFMRQFVSKQLRLGKVRLANEVVHTTADGRRLLVIHGDRYDAVMTQAPWLAHAGDLGYEALLWGGARLNRILRGFDLPEVPVSSRIKAAVKVAVQYLSGFDEQIMARCRADDLKGVVCGHTHHAETRQIRLGIVSYNCGDWVESCTALGEDFAGRISILRTLPVERRDPRKGPNGTVRHDPKQPRPEQRPRTHSPLPGIPVPPGLLNAPTAATHRGAAGGDLQVAGPQGIGDLAQRNRAYPRARA